VLKTLMAEVDGKPVCVAVPSDREVSMKKLAAAFGGKAAKMMRPADAERLTGYHVGGISPFGQKKRVPTAIEQVVLAETSIYLNGGQRGLQIELSPGDGRGADVNVLPLPHRNRTFTCSSRTRDWNLQWAGTSMLLIDFHSSDHKENSDALSSRSYRRCCRIGRGARFGSRLPVVLADVGQQLQSELQLHLLSTVHGHRQRPGRRVRAESDSGVRPAA
jgi:hypothetical protein